MFVLNKLKGRIWTLKQVLIYKTLWKPFVKPMPFPKKKHIILEFILF